MKLNYKNFLPILVFVAVVLGFLNIILSPSENVHHLIGKTVANQTYKSLINVGKEQSLVDAKRYTIIHFFSTWCSTCKFDQDKIRSISLGNTRLIGVLWQDNPINMAKWILEYPNIYQDIIYDPEEKIALNMGLAGIPATVLLDNNGKVLFAHMGELQDEMIKNVIQPKLK
ncbi:MAG: TlpA family protein disulfide reductase [Rickettsiales bacterium]